ncbi:MAG: hypothetical protein ACTHOO_03440 [Alcanivorax sp.]
MELSTADWIGIYGAILSTMLTIVAGIKYLYLTYKKRTEKKKFSTFFYLLRKKDKRTGDIFPVVVLMIANLGTERISFKSVYFSGIAEHGGQMTGSPGWYEEPEAAYGINNRLLPVVLESGQVADLPLLNTGIFTGNKDLKIWLTDFDDKKHYIKKEQINMAKQQITMFQKDKDQTQSVI